MQEPRGCLYLQNNTKHNKAITYLVEHKGYVSGVAHLIVDGFEKGLDINKYSDKSLAYDQAKVIMDGLLAGIDLTSLFSKQTKSCILRLALELLRNGKELPDDLTEERNASEVAIMRECLNEGILYKHYLANNALIPHKDLINNLVKQNPEMNITTEFSWVDSSMSEEYVGLMYKAKVDSVFQESFLECDLYELRQKLSEAYQAKTDSLYSPDRLKAFTIFDDFQS